MSCCVADSFAVVVCLLYVEETTLLHFLFLFVIKRNEENNKNTREMHALFASITNSKPIMEYVVIVCILLFY